MLLTLLSLLALLLLPNAQALPLPLPEAEAQFPVVQLLQQQQQPTKTLHFRLDAGASRGVRIAETSANATRDPAYYITTTTLF